MTRSDLLTDLAGRTNKHTTLDSVTQARFLRFLNQRLRRILTIPGAQKLREATLTFASVASQADYVLPHAARVRRIFETTNDRVLYELSPADYRLVDPDPQTGTPEAFVWRGRSPVAKQPSDASELFIDSTAAGDTGTCYLEGVITGGYERSASVTMTGTTAVSLGATITSWIRVDKLYLSAAAVGVVTLHEDANGGTELARIPIGQTQADYWMFSLWPTPSSVITYTVDYDRTVTDLAQSNDEPPLPEDFHDLLLLGALMDEYQHMQDPRYAVAAQEYDARLKQFYYWIAETATGSGGLLNRA